MYQYPYQQYQQYPRYQQNYPSVQYPQYVPTPNQVDVGQQSNSIQGRIVDGIEVVKSIEVPTQGEFYFPKADGSEIYVKHWTPNYTTEIVRYKRCIEADLDEKPTIPNEDIKSLENTLTESINTIYDKIDRLEKSLNRKKVVDNDTK